MVIHANGKAAKTAVDASGYTVVLDTLGKLSGAAGSITPEKYQTLILKK